MRSRGRDEAFGLMVGKGRSARIGGMTSRSSSLPKAQVQVSRLVNATAFERSRRAGDAGA
jgi:hypothetical protein